MRLLLHPVPPEELVRPVFAAVRAYGWEHTIVVLAALELSRRLVAADAERGEGARTTAVREESAALVERFRTSQPHPLDAARVETALAVLMT